MSSKYWLMKIPMFRKINTAKLKDKLALLQ